MLEKKLMKTIKEYELINKGDKVIVAVSGGADSLSLLNALSEFKTQLGIELFVFHLDHQYRGDESKADAEYVREFSHSLGIESFIYSENIEKYAKVNRMSFEEAGREVRYSLLDTLLIKLEANKIAVAQNKNDQAETLLMRFFRGTSLDGLKGIDYIRDNVVIRPLLDVSRHEIETYLQSRSIEPRLDKTNLQPIYTRNRIRLELLPYIKENFNPNIIDTLSENSKLIRDDLDFIDSEVQKLIKDEVQIYEEYLLLNKSKFISNHIAIKRRLIREVIRIIQGNIVGVTKSNIDEILKVICYGKNGSVVSIKNTDFVLEYDDIRVSKGNTNNKTLEKEIILENQVVVKELGYKFEVSETDHGFKREKSSNYVIYVDKDKIDGQLIIRTRRPGDTFKPIGLNNTKKIKDYFIDSKVPKSERDFVPLLCDNKDILWIVGYRMSEKVKVTKNTVKVLRIAVSKL